MTDLLLKRRYLKQCIWQGSTTLMMRRKEHGETLCLLQQKFWKRQLELDTKIRLLKKLKGFEEISICEDCTDAYEYWKDNFNSNKYDCCNLRIQNKGSGSKYKFIGDPDLMNYPQTAFLCSSSAPQEAINASGRWALEQCSEKRCIMSGFQSQAEKNVLDTLLANNGRAVMVLPFSIYEKCPKKYEDAVNSGRLLIMSFFEDGQFRLNRMNAEKRNRFIIEYADSIVVGYAQEGGMVEKLIKNTSKPKIILYC